MTCSLPVGIVVRQAGKWWSRSWQKTFEEEEENALRVKRQVVVYNSSSLFDINAGILCEDISVQVSDCFRRAQRSFHSP